jgi:hypothetical protein
MVGSYYTNSFSVVALGKNSVGQPTFFRIAVETSASPQTITSGSEKPLALDGIRMGGYDYVFYSI